MKIKKFYSGSKGNLYQVSDGNTSLLLECGVPINKIKKALNYKLSNVDGCLLSHMHGDHSKSAKDIMKAGINLYAAKETAETLGLTGHRLKLAEPGQGFKIGSFYTIPYKSHHDCEGSLYFVIISTETQENCLFITDSYYIEENFKDVISFDYIMIECNYSMKILNHNIENETVPLAMKQRLMESHFELENVKKFLLANDLSKTKEIYLIHISENNGDPEFFKREIQELTGVPVYA